MLYCSIKITKKKCMRCVLVPALIVTKLKKLFTKNSRASRTTQKNENCKIPLENNNFFALFFPTFRREQFNNFRVRNEKWDRNRWTWSILRGIAQQANKINKYFSHYFFFHFFSSICLYNWNIVISICATKKTTKNY